MFDKTQLNGWKEEETLNYFINNRDKYSDLYDSEKYFLTKEFILDIDTVLDVGCATGGMYKILSNINNKIEYIGIDISEKSINYANETLKNEKASFYSYNGNSDFPIEKDKKFDLVFCSGLMHLIDNYENVFKQMLEHTNKYLLVDFRVTTKESYKGKFYFDFSNKNSKENSTNYYVLNFDDLFNFFDKFNEIKRVELYGYKGKANKMSEGIDDVHMIFFKIFINHNRQNNKIDFIVKNNELKKIVDENKLEF